MKRILKLAILLQIAVLLGLVSCTPPLSEMAYDYKAGIPTQLAPRVVNTMHLSGKDPGRLFHLNAAIGSVVDLTWASDQAFSPNDFNSFTARSLNGSLYPLHWVKIPTYEVNLFLSSIIVSGTDDILVNIEASSFLTFTEAINISFSFDYAYHGAQISNH